MEVDREQRKGQSHSGQSDSDMRDDHDRSQDVRTVEDNIRKVFRGDGSSSVIHFFIY